MCALRGEGEGGISFRVQSVVVGRDRLVGFTFSVSVVGRDRGLKINNKKNKKNKNKKNKKKMRPTGGSNPRPLD